MTCCLCNQPMALGEAVNTHNPTQAEHAFRRDCVRAVARRCAEIADQQAKQWVAPSEGARPIPEAECGAYCVRNAIQKEFGV